VVKSINSLIESGIGDRDRLEYILNRVSEGKYLYLSDKNYLENLLQSIPIQKQYSRRSEDNNIENELLNELRSLSKRVERIENADNFDIGEKTKSKPIELGPNLTQEKSNDEISKKRTTQKNEEITLALSIVLGLVGLTGISQIYLGKVAKGIGIMIISFMLIGSTAYFLSTNMSENGFNTPIVKNSFLIVAVVGYFGLYIYQVFDARKLCFTYNKYVVEHKTSPPWW
jgi:TM2 domain-containing membrane protein YozV